MIEKVLSFEFIKKSPLYGSFQGMHYRVTEKKGELEVCVFPGPMSFDHVSEEEKIYKNFEYSDAGYDQAIAYLNKMYEERDWRNAFETR